MTRGDDQDLVEATLAGDRTAFGKLVEKYRKPLYNVAYQITGSVDDAMDTTQTAFVSAYENLQGFDPRYRFFSWIYRIAVNEAIDVVKRRRESALPERLPDLDNVSPEAELESAETARRVQKAILALTEEQRAVVVLRHYRGLSYREMADVIGIPAKTVKSRLYSARQKLRELLLEAGVEKWWRRYQER